MRKAIALLLGMLLPILGMAEIGQAQSGVQVQGTIQAADCLHQTVVLSDAGGSTTVGATGSTAVVVNSTGVPFCALEQYVGSPATAWLVANGNEFQATQIDVVGPATTAAPPAPAPTVGSPSTLGVILGAVAIGALGYVLGHQSANQPQPVYQPYAPGYYQPQSTYRPPDRSGYAQYQPAYQYDQGRRVPRNGGGNYYNGQCGYGAWNRPCPATNAHEGPAH